MSAEKLQKQLASLQEFISLLESLGITADRTRIGRYRKYLEIYTNAFQAERNKELEKDPQYAEYQPSFYEIKLMLDMYAGLKCGSINEELKKRLKTYASGPLNIDDENAEKGNNNPRDIGFELFIDGRLLRAGYTVSFGVEGDLEYIEDGEEYFLECKRPSSEKQIEANIEKAFKQLERRYAASPNGKGLVALSISKLVNKQHYTLSVLVEAMLDSVVQNTLNEFLRSHAHLWSLPHSDNTVGALVLLEVPHYIANEDNFGISTFVTVIGFCDAKSDSFEIFEKMYGRMVESLK